MKIRLFPLAVAAALMFCCTGQCRAQGFADEAKDWGVAPPSTLRRAPYSAPTPLEIPGARVVRTEELRRLAAETPKPLLIDVASGEGHTTLTGALWWPGVGRGSNFLDPIQADFAARLAQVSAGEKTSGLVFYCVNAQCWLSYNASLRAVALGYTRVLWYRGGVEAWRAAGLPLAQVREPWAAAVPAASDAEQPR